MLLHSLSERYRALGDPAMAAGLLRRATVHIAQPISCSHLDSSLRALLALGEVLEASGATPEEGVALYSAAAARGAGGLGGAADAVLEGIAQSQAIARERAARLAAMLGQ